MIIPQAEIEGRKGIFHSLNKFGEKLLQETTDNEETVNQNLKKLEEIKSNVRKLQIFLLFFVLWGKKYNQFKVRLALSCLF